MTITAHCIKSMTWGEMTKDHKPEEGKECMELMCKRKDV